MVTLAFKLYDLKDIIDRIRGSLGSRGEIGIGMGLQDRNR